MAKDEVKPARKVTIGHCSRCDRDNQVIRLIKDKVCSACVTFDHYHKIRNHIGDVEYWTERKLFHERGQNRITYMRATSNKARPLI